MDRDAPPRVRPQEPKTEDPAAGKIEIEPGPKRHGTARGPRLSPEQYWLDYYRKHDEDPSDLKEKVAMLNVNRKFRDVQAVLWGFLKHHGKTSEPWMYEALAIAIKMNGGKDADAKTALGYAADLAVRSRNPNHLVSVADQLLLMGDYPRVGALLDQAAALIPHRAEPLMMSIILAQKIRDPKRMGDSIDALLSLGWPGKDTDEVLRRDAHTQAETLAKTLREQGREAEADALLARLPEAEARDLFIRLTWVGEAGLDLAVEEPLGATARVVTPRTVFGGSIIKDGYGKHPEDVYVCPRGFDGTYTVRVETSYNNPEKPALKANLEIITHEGTPQEHRETRTVAIDPGGKPSEPVKVTLKGGRRTRALPFVAPSLSNPPSLAGPANRSRRGAPATPTAPRPLRPGPASVDRSPAK